MLREVTMQPRQNVLLEILERPFWQLYLSLIVMDSALVIIGSIILGSLQRMSDLYFWSTLILLIVAALPILFELGTSAKIAGKAIKDGEKVGSQLKDKKATFDLGARITYLFGLAGITTFIFAILSLGIS
jgi:hypothetical protein